MSEIDDLLGDEPRQFYSDPPKNELKPVTSSATGGVSIPWLVTNFRMGRGKVEKLLQQGGVRPLRHANNGGAYFDLPAAASCLVTPKQDFNAFLKTLKPSDLPVQMQDAWWAAKLKEQKFRSQAGDLWPTAAVMQVFGDTHKMIKNKVQLWPDTIVESVGMNDEQREVMHQLMVDLLNELAESLMDDSKINETRSQLAELDEIT